MECSRRTLWTLWTLWTQVTELAPRCARRTLQLAAIVARLAITLTGRAGAPMLADVGVPISRRPYCRALSALPVPPEPMPKVLGVHDVALRRGHR
jgi:hypothetical protein